ncbi:MAG: DUF1349 domain-containing protein [Spirochaetaceae bacterium]|nr:DUF1349 domain-containing protein [Spirochaetaceae bacterium]
MIYKNKIDENFHWFNEPEFTIEKNRLKVRSFPHTDFWQTTHYGFKRDNGHCLLTKVQKDFSMTVRTEFEPKKQYDQCGLIVRLNSENWIKISTEYESDKHSRLGSVVTNWGYSDWASIDVHSKINEMWYRIQNKGHDFLLEFSKNGKKWHQLRITHLHETFRRVSAGVYSCSPSDSSFTAVFDHFQLADSNW